MSRSIGTHALEVEGDILKLTVRGTFTLEDMKQFTALAAEHATTLGYMLVLNDVNAAGGLSAEARRYSAELTREAMRNGPIYSASASYGSTVIIRALVTLYYSMLRLVTGGGHRNYIAKSEDEARAFLTEQRQRFQTELKSRGKIPG